MTDEERAEADAQAAQWNALVAAATPAVPACWSWSVPFLDDVELTPTLDARPDSARLRAAGRFVLFHDGRCAVCGAHRATVLDHDHDTGLERGNLCRSCNAHEGGQSRGGGPLFDMYRQRNPAMILGYAARYVSPFTGREDLGTGPPPTDEELWRDHPLRGVGL